jgi:CheY-like chemotaxis protein
VLVLCALALEREGYHVLTAEDARQGLKLAFENDPAVIVVDAAIEGGRDLAPDAEPLVDLPGLGFARVLATDQKLRRVPVVVSAPPGEGVREALELAGVAGVLAEPITPEGLAAEVKRAMGSWLERTGY